MPITMEIHMDGDSCWPDLRPVGSFEEAKLIGVARLQGGMTSGNSSVCFRFHGPDGKVYLAETSMALFQTAAKVFQTADEGRVWQEPDKRKP